MKLNFFTIAIDTFNHEDWIAKCIESCTNQKYKNYEVIVMDAVSNDNTFNIANNLKNKYPNLKVFKNNERLPQVANFLELAKLAKRKSIIVSVDGDDWLKHENVLTILNETYNSSDIWMTYGTYEEYPYNDVTKKYFAYPDDIINNNLFREYNWLASHLRTFKRDLIFKINPLDLKNENGEWLDTTGDQAIMLPMLEMSGNRSKFIRDCLYVYNKSNTNRDTNHNESRQIELANYIRSKPKYLPLKNLK